MRTALALVILLSGCATIASLRDAAPRATYSSHQSAPALEQCLAGSLSWIDAPSIIHGERSTELAFGRGYGDTFLLVSLTPSANGTAVEVREQDRYGGKARRSVESCL